MKEFNMMQCLKEAKISPFLLGSGIEIGYVSGFPILATLNGKVCVKVPFLRYKVTGTVDKTLVFPIKYLATFSLPDMKPVGFEDLSCNIRFRKVDFGKPVGFFRHEAIRHLSKKGYQAKKEELMALYGRMAEAMMKKEDFSEETEFKALLNMMLEPSVKPIYEILDRTFYEKYLG